MAKGIKTGGRQQGTPNKTTSEIRELITEFVSINWQRVQTDFEQLEPKERLQFFEKLMQYAVPKMQSVNYEFELDSKLQKLSEEELDEIIERISENIGVPKKKAKLPEWFHEEDTP